jgi:purine-binding chemotaxis protein CheW
MNQELNTYLVFKIGNHPFGIHVEKVLEISEYKEPKPVPESPSYMKGVIEFREQVIPVIDTGLKFNMPSITITPTTCVVVMELMNPLLSKKFRIGVLTDAVTDVFDATEENRMAMDEEFKPGFISGGCQTAHGLVMLLNADLVFSDKDVIAIEEAMGNM